MRLRHTILGCAVIASGCLVPRYDVDSGPAPSGGGSAGASAGASSTSGSSGASMAGTGGLDCTATQKVCNGRCVEVDDPAYGCSPTSCQVSDCPIVTGETLACEQGQCVIGSCGAGSKMCDGKCVAVDDPSYGCSPTSCDDSACPDPGTGTLLCEAGACVIGTCPMGTKECNQKCVPPDRNNGCRAPDSCDPCTAIEACGLASDAGCECQPEPNLCSGVLCGKVMSRCGTEVDCPNTCPGACSENECVDCVTPLDCPSAGRNPCALAKCSNGECSFIAHPSTTECAGGKCSTTDIGVCERPAVNAGGVSIDATEVTRGQYHKFVVAMAGSTPSQPAVCSWNTDIAPKYDEPPAMEDYDVPVTFVDWCDAYAYCAWAGRRLCGKIGGGTNATADLADATRSQWFKACTGPSGYTYPYGNDYEPSTCVTEPPYPDQGKPADAAYYSGCVGGYPGLYDMSGNLFEWEDSCNASTGPDDVCRIRGGGYAGFDIEDRPAGMRCDNAQWSDRSQRQQHFGFRCCGP